MNTQRQDWGDIIKIKNKEKEAETTQSSWGNVQGGWEDRGETQSPWGAVQGEQAGQGSGVCGMRVWAAGNGSGQVWAGTHEEQSWGKQSGVKWRQGRPGRQTEVG